MPIIQPVHDVTITDEFWGRFRSLVAERVLPYQWSALNDALPDTPPSHAIENLRIAAGESQGQFYGMVFQDSDVAKWIEAAAYTLRDREDVALRQAIDDTVALLGRVQQPDGYLNSFYIVCEPPENRWNNLRDCHELYCAGHLIEAGVAYFESTGSRELLDIVTRYADLIDSVFGPLPGQKRGYPGHPEIELALLRLADATGESRYIALAEFFIRERGTQPHYFDLEAQRRTELAITPRAFPTINPADVDAEHLNYRLGYSFQQAHEPFLEQRAATGHAVRAMYLYAAAADLARRTGDEGLLLAVRELWADVVDRKLYVTAGIGSQVPGESFTGPYDLPNETMYCETCATVGLVFLAHRMLRIESRSEYADVLERAIYNGSISGVSLDGESYFYINPQEFSDAMRQRVTGWDISSPVNRRESWFNCSCCPTNLARMIASIERYVYTATDSRLDVHLYVGSETVVHLAGTAVTITQTSDLPWQGSSRITVSPLRSAVFALGLRMPAWSSHWSVTVNGEPVPDARSEHGYMVIEREWSAGDRVAVQLDLTPRRVRGNPRIRDNVGRVALQRGPIVYCVEQADNGPDLAQLRIRADSPIESTFEGDVLGGVVILTVDGERIDADAWGDGLYRSDVEYARTPARITAIPYYAWANREQGEMRIWLPEK